MSYLDRKVTFAEANALINRLVYCTAYDGYFRVLFVEDRGEENPLVLIRKTHCAEALPFKDYIPESHKLDALFIYPVNKAYLERLKRDSDTLISRLSEMPVHSETIGGTT